MAFKAVFKGRICYNHSCNTSLSSYCVPAAVVSPGCIQRVCIPRGTGRTPQNIEYVLSTSGSIDSGGIRWDWYTLSIRISKIPISIICYYDNASSKKLSLLLQHGGHSCLSNTTDYIIGQCTGRLPMTAKVAYASLS